MHPLTARYDLAVALRASLRGEAATRVEELQRRVSLQSRLASLEVRDAPNCARTRTSPAPLTAPLPRQTCLVAITRQRESLRADCEVLRASSASLQPRVAALEAALSGSVSEGERLEQSRAALRSGVTSLETQLAALAHTAAASAAALEPAAARVRDLHVRAGRWRRGGARAPHTHT